MVLVGNMSQNLSIPDITVSAVFHDPASAVEGMKSEVDYTICLVRPACGHVVDTDRDLGTCHHLRLCGRH